MNTLRNSFFLSGMLSALFMVSATQAVEKPNIIVILDDDLGYNDLGVYGCEDIPTPHFNATPRDCHRSHLGVLLTY